MKITMACFMLLFVCSCHDNSGNSISDDSKKTNRSEEVLKIMREYEIHVAEAEIGDDYELSAESKEKKLSELSRAKEDYYYVMNPNHIPLTLPASDWEIRGPLPFDNAPTYENLREKCEEGDELYFYRSSVISWGDLMGREGYVIIRDNKVVAMIDTAIN